MKKYGLIGKQLAHSFSLDYFTQKFLTQNISDSIYQLHEIESIKHLPDLVRQNPGLVGLNVTIPFKEQVLDLLDTISPEASAVGAVNTILIGNNATLHGYNTDVHGFRLTLERHLPVINTSALILGTGGASKAISYVLSERGVKFTLVSRHSSMNTISYDQLKQEHYDTHKLIINTTPLGMFPNIESSPAIDYNSLTNQHTLVDLVYNPSVTRFLAQGKRRGSVTINGLEMLHAQAEQSWIIWNQKLKS
jgi:shikimate dehydrogenase